MVRASNRSGFGRAAGRAAALAFASLCVACTGVADPGYSIVTQDKFNFLTCPEIVSQRNTLRAREKELSDLVDKADASPGGLLVSVTAYRSELVSTRTQLRLVTQAAQEKGCDAAKSKS